MFTKTEIQQQLTDMHAPQDSVVLIHSSLRTIGATEGRGEGLLEVLIEYFTAKGGLLCIPTHTWANISAPDRITLDLIENKTCIGTLPDLAAKHPDAVRSLHPTHSMAVFGEKSRAKVFIAGEDKLITPAHPSGCYGKIYENNGFILLAGVGHNRNTYLHCVEEMLHMPNRLAKTPATTTIRHKSGAIERRLVHPHEAVGIGDVSLRYPKYEPAFRHHNCIIDGQLGNASAQLCSARGMKNVMEQIHTRSHGAELMLDDTPINPEFYME